MQSADDRTCNANAGSDEILSASIDGQKILHDIMSATTGRIVLVDKDGKILCVSLETAKAMGAEPQSFIGKTWREAGFPESDAVPFIKRAHEVIASGMRARGLFRRPTPNGTEYLDYDIVPVRGKDGAVEALVFTFVDVTERERTEEELKRNEGRFRAISDAAFESILITDNENIIDLNQAVLNFTGYNREEVIGKSMLDLFAEESKGIVQKSLQTVSPGSIEARIRKKDGSILIALIRVRSIDYLGKAARVTTIQDVTEIRTRAELSESIGRINSQIISTLNFDEIMQRVLVESCRTFGCDDAGVGMREGDRWIMRYSYGDLPAKFIEGPVPEAQTKICSIVMVSGEVWAVPDTYNEKRINKRKIREVGIRAFIAIPLKIKREVIGVIGFDWLSGPTKFTPAQIDFANQLKTMLSLAIENSRLYEKELMERRRLSTILDTLPVGVYIADAQGAVSEKNELASRVWGGKIPPFRSISDYAAFKGSWADTGIQLKPEDWGMARAIQKGETSIGEVIDIQRFDGTRGTILHSAAPLRDPNGRIIGGVAVIQDITRQRQLEQDALEAKDQVEFYIDLLVHDLQNLNTSAMGYLELAEERFKPEGKEKNLLRGPLEALQTGSELIENIRKIKQIDSEELRQCMIDLGIILEEVMELYQENQVRDVRIEYKPTINKFVFANELLRDVFGNIVGNAIKHSSGAVVVNIDLRKTYESAREYYKVTIEDNGPGIPDELKRKLFGRLTSGKTKTSGGGIGLYLVKRLVEDFNGRVWVEDRVPGDHTKGARFVVMLPAVARSRQETAL